VRLLLKRSFRLDCQFGRHNRDKRDRLSISLRSEPWIRRGHNSGGFGAKFNVWNFGQQAWLNSASAVFLGLWRFVYSLGCDATSFRVPSAFEEHQHHH
jgi:hypothetical protein